MSTGTILLIMAIPCSIFIGFAIRAYLGRIKLNSAEAQSHRIVQDAVREAETKRKELLIEAKDQLIKEKNLLEKEMRERRQELQTVERRILQKEENIDKKVQVLEKQEKELQAKEKDNLEKVNYQRNKRPKKDYSQNNVV